MTTIKITDGVTKKTDWAMAAPVNFALEEGEHIAIVGCNGSGKSMLVDIITGRHPVFPQMATYHFEGSEDRLTSENIKYISFRDTYGGDNDRTYFLQQRWNLTEIDEETPTVGSKLEEAFQLAGNDTPERRTLQRHLYEMFHLEALLDKYIILLSSGELRKYKLAASLFGDPRVLIMDNPFIGLDAQTRDQLRDLLAMLAEERHLQIILVLSKSDEIPEFITHVVEVEALQVKPKCTRQTYLDERPPFPTRVLTDEKQETIRHILGGKDETQDYHEVIRFRQVSIRYGKRTILKDLDWTVRKGERWSLSGQNGSGKSTLLSLVCADNPQRYACDITLFGREKNSGVSIWDIKRRIGYVSPEMHRAYQKDLPAIRIVASGLKDSVGLYVKPDATEYDVCRQWMDIFGLEGLYDRPFLHLSSGEQRLVLLARAFVKCPDLLILDEPLHGLDNVNRRRVKDIIETYFEQAGKTLIFVTHYKEELPNVIDHSLWLERH